MGVLYGFILSYQGLSSDDSFLKTETFNRLSDTPGCLRAIAEDLSVPDLCWFLIFAPSPFSPFLNAVLLGGWTNLDASYTRRNGTSNHGSGQSYAISPLFGLLLILSPPYHTKGNILK